MKSSINTFLLLTIFSCSTYTKSYRSIIKQKQLPQICSPSLEKELESFNYSFDIERDNFINHENKEDYLKYYTGVKGSFAPSYERRVSELKAFSKDYPISKNTYNKAYKYCTEGISKTFNLDKIISDLQKVIKVNKIKYKERKKIAERLVAHVVENSEKCKQQEYVEYLRLDVAYKLSLQSYAKSLFDYFLHKKDQAHIRKSLKLYCSASPYKVFNETAVKVHPAPGVYHTHKNGMFEKYPQLGIIANKIKTLNRFGDIIDALRIDEDKHQNQ